MKMNTLTVNNTTELYQMIVDSIDKQFGTIPLQIQGRETESPKLLVNDIDVTDHIGYVLTFDEYTNKTIVQEKTWSDKLRGVDADMLPAKAKELVQFAKVKIEDKARVDRRDTFFVKLE